MTPKNIVMVTLNLEVGGLERVVVDLTLALATKGHQLSVITLRGGGPLEAPLNAAGVSVYSLHCGDGLKFSYAKQLATQLRKIGPDLVHSHGEAALFYCGLNRLLPGLAPHFAHVHTRHGYEDVSTKGVWRNRLGHMGCDQVVCVSADLAHHCATVEKLAEGKLNTVINGVNLSPYRELADCPYVPDAPVIGHVARLASVKNQALLLTAFAQVHSQWPDARLSIVGDGPERSALESLAASLNIHDAVVFHGETSNVPAKLAQAHLFCLSSDSEGTPVSIIEALAAGRPIAATRVGGLPALVPETAGVLTPAGQASALAEAISAIYADDATYAAFCNGARQAPAGQHDAQAMLDQYLGIYQRAG